MITTPAKFRNYRIVGRPRGKYEVEWEESHFGQWFKFGTALDRELYAQRFSKRPPPRTGRFAYDLKSHKSASLQPTV